MTLEINRANADVTGRLVGAGLTLDQVEAFDNTGRVDGWEGPDMRIVSNGRDIPLGSLEDAAFFAQARKLFPLVVAWRFHCTMQEYPVFNATEVSFGENRNHVRHRGRWFRRIGEAFRSMFGARRKQQPLPAATPGAPAPAKRRGFFSQPFSQGEILGPQYVE